MNRRNFIQSILTSAIAPMFLPGAGRKWMKTDLLIVPDNTIVKVNRILPYFGNFTQSEGNIRFIPISEYFK